MQPREPAGQPQRVEGTSSGESLWVKWSALSSGQRILMARAGLWLPVFSLAVNALPLRRILSAMDLDQVSLDDGMPAPGVVDAAQAMDVARALSAVAARLPWTSTCLARALAGAWLLHRSALSATITLGVARGLPGDHGGDGVVAHAWLDHGDVTVTGGAQGRFLPVGRFVG